MKNENNRAFFAAAAESVRTSEKETFTNAEVAGLIERLAREHQVFSHIEWLNDKHNNDALDDLKDVDPVTTICDRKRLSTAPATALSSLASRIEWYDSIMHGVFAAADTEYSTKAETVQARKEAAKKAAATAVANTLSNDDLLALLTARGITMPAPTEAAKPEAAKPKAKK